MRSSSLRVVVVACLAVMAAACNGDTPTTSATTSVGPTTTTSDAATSTTGVPASTSTTGAASTTITGEETTTTEATSRTEPPPFQEVELLFPTAGEMGSEWEQAFVIPYGTTPDTLGTSPGGDGSLDLGPEYGAQTGDGSWWFLDGANRRVAHFSESGEYVDDIPVPDELLVNGHFPYQIPKALDDGTVVAVSFSADEQTNLLLAGDGEVSGTSIPGTMAPRTTDGSRLFMEDLDGGLFAVTPRSGAAQPVDWLVARGGARFSVHRESGDTFMVRLPDAGAGLERRLTFRWADDTSVPVFGGIEVDTGLDNTLFFYLTGVAEIDPDNAVPVTGFFTISNDGLVSAVEPTLDPFSPSDPGSPAHLGVRPATAAPWLMFVLTDGVHVYTRRTG